MIHETTSEYLTFNKKYANILYAKKEKLCTRLTIKDSE